MELSPSEGAQKSWKLSNDQELEQSEPKSHPQGKVGDNQDYK